MNIYLIPGVIVLLSSCAFSRFYNPNSIATPYYERKGDMYFDFSSQIDSKFDLYAGAAFSRNFGFYAGYNESIERNRGLVFDPVHKLSSRSRGFCLGLGYFDNIDQSEKRRWELYAEIAHMNYLLQDGYQITAFKDNTYPNIRGAYFRGSMLFNYAWVTGKKKIGFSLRPGLVRYMTPSFVHPEKLEQERDRINSKREYLVCESAVNLLFGKKALKFKVQLGVYGCFNSSQDVNAIYTIKSSLVFGLILNPNLIAND